VRKGRGQLLPWGCPKPNLLKVKGPELKPFTINREVVILAIGI
jgi:hypothetical protein